MKVDINSVVLIPFSQLTQEEKIASRNIRNEARTQELSFVPEVSLETHMNFLSKMEGDNPTIFAFMVKGLLPDETELIEGGKIFAINYDKERRTTFMGFHFIEEFDTAEVLEAICVETFLPFLRDELDVLSVSIKGFPSHPVEEMRIGVLKKLGFIESEPYSQNGKDGFIYTLRF